MTLAICLWAKICILQRKFWSSSLWVVACAELVWTFKRFSPFLTSMLTQHVSWLHSNVCIWFESSSCNLFWRTKLFCLLYKTNKNPLHSNNTMWNPHIHRCLRNLTFLLSASLIQYAGLAFWESNCVLFLWVFSGLFFFFPNLSIPITDFVVRESMLFTVPLDRPFISSLD